MQFGLAGSTVRITHNNVKGADVMKAVASLVFAGLLFAGAALAAAPVTVEGTLVDSACYLKDGAATNDHGPMKSCGTMCLKGGTPAAVLTKDKKLHLIVAASPALADHVGSIVRVTGEANGTAILAQKVQVNKGGKWEDVKIGAAM